MRACKPCECHFPSNYPSCFHTVWKETLAFPIEIPESVLDVVVLDKDTLSGDDLIGKTKIQVDLIIKADGYVDTW